MIDKIAAWSNYLPNLPKIAKINLKHDQSFWRLFVYLEVEDDNQGQHINKIHGKHIFKL